MLKYLAEKHNIALVEMIQKEREELMSEKSRGGLSFISGKKARTVCSERGFSGRFKQKYKVGDKAADGSIIKEVIEENW